MNDYQIRTELRRLLDKRFSGDPETRILNELGLRHGAARIDIAVINGSLDGYEIKSDLDTLRRLPNQMRIYNSVLDRVTLVATPRHVDSAMLIIPEWWGVKLADASKRNIHFSDVRMPGSNPAPDPIAIAKLLWRDEALGILREVGAAAGFTSKPRRIIYKRLAEALDLWSLRQRVRQQLRDRKGWRSDGLQKLNGG